MKRCIMLCLALLFSLTTQAQKDDFNIAQMFPFDRGHSYIGFSIKYMGYAYVRGRFKDFQGSIRFDERDVTKTSVTFSAETKSIDTANEWRDRDLQSDQWFDATTFPKITFISRRTEKTPEGILVTGDLTMRGVTRSVSIPLSHVPTVVADIRDDSQIVFNGTITLNRQDYGIEGKRWSGVRNAMTAVSDDVTVELTVLAKRINAGNFRNWVADLNSPKGKLYAIAKNKGAKEAVTEFDNMRAEDKEQLTQEALNDAGQMLLKEGKVNDAMVLFKSNAAAFPQSVVVFLSLGEASATAGKWDDAKKYYKQVLERDSGNAMALEVLRHLE